MRMIPTLGTLMLLTSAASAHEASGLPHAHPHAAMTAVPLGALVVLWAGIALLRRREKVRNRGED